MRILPPAKNESFNKTIGWFDECRCDFLFASDPTDTWQLTLFGNFGYI